MMGAMVLSWARSLGNGTLNRMVPSSVSGNATGSSLSVFRFGLSRLALPITYPLLRPPPIPSPSEGGGLGRECGSPVWVFLKCNGLSSDPLHDAHSDIRSGAGVAVDGPTSGALDLKPVVTKVLFNASLQLPQGEDRLHQTGGPHRMAAGDQASRRVDGKRPGLLEIKAVVEIGQKRVPLLRPSTTLPVLAEAHILVGLDLGRGIGIVQLDEVQLLDRMGDPGHLVGQLGGHPARPK